MIAIDLKPNEPLHIGDNIVIVVAGVDRAEVKLGINAPREIAVVRAEIKPRKQPPSR